MEPVSLSSGLGSISQMMSATTTRAIANAMLLYRSIRTDQRRASARDEPHGPGQRKSNHLAVRTFAREKVHHSERPAAWGRESRWAMPMLSTRWLVGAA
jgi:hypothetical protein